MNVISEGLIQSITSHLESILVVVLSSLLSSINLSISLPGFPVPEWVGVMSIVNVLLSLHSTVRINDGGLVEWLGLVVSVSILGSHNVSVSVLLGGPGSLIKQLSIGLESRGDGASSVALVEGIIVLNLTQWDLGVSIWLGSRGWLQVGLPESGAPLFVNSWMWGEHCCFTVTSEERWSGLIEVLLISHESLALESCMRCLEVTLLIEASS